MLLKALDYNARKVTSKFRIPFGTHLYDRQWLAHPNLDVNRMTLPVNHGRFTGRGIRIVQISDLHLGLYVGNEQLMWLSNIIQDLHPDLLFITGDFVNSKASEAYSSRQGLRALAEVAPTYGVLGNHDFWHQPEALSSFLESTGIRMLRNSHTQLDINGNPVLLVGVDDWKTGHDDLEKAVRGMPEDTKFFKLLLSHCPDLLHPASELGFDLVLAGHTHGSQVRVPLLGPAISRWMHGEFERGWAKAKDTALYINRGLGAVFLPVRYRSAAEVTVLNLAQATARHAA